MPDQVIQQAEVANLKVVALSIKNSKPYKTLGANVEQETISRHLHDHHHGFWQIKDYYNSSTLCFRTKIKANWLYWSRSLEPLKLISNSTTDHLLGDSGLSQRAGNFSLY